jgi:ATP-dependent Clp protease ATP-binding subunit ClpA
MGHRYIGTEHLLLGLIAQTDALTASLLNQLNISPDEVRKNTRRVLQTSVLEDEQSESGEGAQSKEPPPADSEQERQARGAGLIPPRQHFAGEWRITLGIARAAAIQLKSKLLEPEHLLVALLLDEGDKTGKLLRNASVDLDRVLEAIQASRVPASEPVIDAEMSPKMVEILGYATAASWKSHNYYLQVEHLLLGLLRQKDNAALNILKELNVSLDELEKTTRESLQK